MTPLARAGGARIALTLVLLAYGWLVFGSGFDRLSGQIPGLERVVPGPFRAQAERTAAVLAGARNQRAALMAHAQSAVLRDPVDPGAPPLLGAARLLAGDEKGAEQAYRVAAQLGWRDVSTQAYWFEAAMEAGEMGPAADRLDALLRAHPGFPGSDGLLARIESTEPGRQALVRRMTERPGWLSNYMQVSSVPAAEVVRRAAILAQLGARGTRLGCAAVQPFVASALASGQRQPAEQAWLGQCPGARLSQGIADAGFDQFGSDQASPFGWQVPPSGDVTVEPLGTAGRDRRVQVSNAASVSRAVLTQAVALPAGRYRLTVKAPAGRIAASIACGQTLPLPHLVDGDPGRGGQNIEVPTCAQLTLGLWLRPGSGPTEIDDVAVTRLP